MFSHTYHVIRSRTNGNYLVARPEEASDSPAFLLLFQEDYDALSYLNTHANDAQRSQLAVESISGSQVSTIISRWNFKGAGIVMDPLIPSVEFVSL